MQNQESAKINDTSSNQEQILNLIQSIQSKLNEESTTNNSNIKNSNEFNKDESAHSNNSDYNNTQDTNANEINNFDFSKILNNINIGQILGMFGNSNNASDTNKHNDSNSNGFNIDTATILKLQRVLSKITDNNPKKNLLLSLKPFLRKSRQDKLNEYITMLTLIDAFEAFSSKGSDDNVWL